ncbi:hypothetical protein WA026_010556 [Henosepilachna vigintioctopunctata]|uniref:Pseudouridine synthase RsuA/RluA-like domain-containing protein n=1 Tax=Henosepilachna vigintioctopunctata TaxID=420089 RepID=A0AAW1VAK5_9CUCU
MIASLAIIICFIRELFLPSRQSRIIKITENFLAVNKAFDLKINSNEPNEVTLQTFLKKAFPSLANGTLYHEFYFVHRLDFSTSGVMCIPLNRNACTAAALAFRNGTTEKYYIALVRGWFSVDFIDVNVPIGEDQNNTEIQRMSCDNINYTNPKTARSLITVLEKGMFKNYPSSKILIRPVTGRRHQIRVHCNYLGHTIIGDFTYSNRKDIEPFRMYLHALRLVVPTNLEYFNVQCEDPFLYDKDWNSIEIINDFNCDILRKLKAEPDN